MSESEHHVLPVATYLKVFATLMVMTFLTVFVAFMNLGAMNNVMMLGIAFFKASLVVMIFMHLKYNAKILWFTASCGFVFLAVLIALTLGDLMSRGWDPSQPTTWL